MKHAMRVLGVLALLAAAGLGIIAWQISREGSGAVEQWVGRQIVGLANGYLKPTLHFADLDYEYPLTVRLQELRLTASDPASPGGTLDVISAERATVVLAAAPRVGQPIRIGRIILQRPVVQLVAMGPESGKLVGFSDLLRDEPATKPTTGPTTRLSDVFEMRLVELIDGKVVYDPRKAGYPAMDLDGIGTRMDIVPASAGWYEVRLGAKRAPVFKLTAAGKVNLDRFDLEDLAIDLTARLGREEETFLPPQLQKFLKDNEVSGAMDAKVAGSASITDFGRSRLQASAKLSGANVSAGEYRVPVKNLEVAAELTEGQVRVPRLRLEALRGHAEASGVVKLNDRLDGRISLRIVNLMLEDTLRRVPAGEEAPKYAGRLNASLTVDGPLAGVIARAASTRPVIGVAAMPANWGGGDVRLDQARLTQVAVLKNLNETIGKVVSLVGVTTKEKAAEKVGIAFTLAGNAAQFSEITYSSPTVAVKGKGTITLDRRLDLTFNGGPAERVGAMFGKTAAGAINRLTGSVAAYRVTGTIEEPKVAMELARGAAGDVGEKVGDVGKNVGKGVGKIGEGLKELIKDKK